MRFGQWWNLSLRGNWWNQMWRSLRITIASTKRSNSHSIWPGNSNVAAGLGTCSQTKEKIKPGTKMDVGREKLLVEMGKLMIWQGGKQQLKSGIRRCWLSRKVGATGIQFKLSGKTWLAVNSEKGLAPEFILWVSCVSLFCFVRPEIFLLSFEWLR